MHTIVVTRQRTQRVWSRKKDGFVRIPVECSLCHKPLKEGDKAIRTSTKYFCLECEKKLYIDVPDLEESDEEIENFFKTVT